MRRHGRATVRAVCLLAGALALGTGAAAPASEREDAAEALGRLLSHESVIEKDGEPIVRLEQRVEVDGCYAVVTTSHFVPGTDRRRMVERSRFQIGHMERIEPEPEEGDVGAPRSIDLTARDYFMRGRDRGLSRWLDALAETRDAQDRAAEMRELQFRVEQGEFGAFARANGYEMRSYLEGDPEPYYAMPLPAVSLTLPEEEAEEASAAWSRYAARHCPPLTGGRRS